MFQFKVSKIKNLPENSISLVKDTFWLIGLNILQKIFGLLTTYVLVRMLSHSAYGEYNFILTILGLVSISALPSIDDAVMQSVSRGHLGTYKKSLKIKFLSSLTGSFLLVCLSLWFYSDANYDLSYACLATALLFPLAYGFTQWRSFRMGKGDFPSITKIDGLSSFLTSTLIVCFSIAIPETIIVPIIIILSIKSLIDLRLTKITIKQQHGCDIKAEPDSIKYGIRTSLFSILGQTAMTIDKIMIFFFLSSASLAIYVAAEKLPEIIKGLIKSLAGALAPRFAKHKHYTAEVDKSLKLFSAFIFISLVIFAFTLMPWAIILIFGESYSEAVPYGQALMCITAIGNIAPLKGRFFKSKLDEKSMREFLVSTSVIRIIASIIFIPLWGLNGAVLSYFVARMSTTIAVHIIMKKRYPIHHSEK